MSEENNFDPQLIALIRDFSKELNTCPDPSCKRFTLLQYQEGKGLCLVIVATYRHPWFVRYAAGFRGYPVELTIETGNLAADIRIVPPVRQN